MADVTLLEVHLDGLNVTPPRPFGGSSTPEPAAESEDYSGGRSSSLPALLVGLVFLVVVAVVVRRKLGGTVTGTEPTEP